MHIEDIKESNIASFELHTSASFIASSYLPSHLKVNNLYYTKLLHKGLIVKAFV